MVASAIYVIMTASLRVLLSGRQNIPKHFGRYHSKGGRFLVAFDHIFENMGDPISRSL